MQLGLNKNHLCLLFEVSCRFREWPDFLTINRSAKNLNWSKSSILRVSLHGDMQDGRNAHQGLHISGSNLERNIKVSGRERPEPIWYPDTYFLLVHSMEYSAEEQSVEFMSHGVVEFIRKVRLVTPCTPNVILFPFDIVNCTLQLSRLTFLSSYDSD